MLQIASQHFPELNALNIFSVTVKDMGLMDSQREINLVIFDLNYILIHVNIPPYSVLNWEYLQMLALGTTLMTVSLINSLFPRIWLVKKKMGMHGQSQVEILNQFTGS